MISFELIETLCFLWLIIGFIIMTIFIDIEGLNEHKFEKCSAIVLFWPFLIVICIVCFVLSVMLGAFKGLYYIVKSLVKEE